MTVEKDTTFNKFTNGKGKKKITVKELKEKNERLKRQYAPVKIMSAKEYMKEKEQCLNLKRP